MYSSVPPLAGPECNLDFARNPQSLEIHRIFPNAHSHIKPLIQPLWKKSVFHPETEIMTTDSLYSHAGF